ncbi:MAG TPA: hypothetical protein VNW92_22360 [Polyangiaceae bacterium]|jgi:hypothetical protein|nr:hypothetical protein [Polyangiaceae bacterium]
MTDDERRRAFAVAFIAQARSDWRVYRILAERDEVLSCHRLHYLQMVCEKLAKAYRLRDTKSPIDELVAKHAGFSKFIGPFFAALKDEYTGKDQQLRGLIQRARTPAREIEKLAPAIDRAASPENAEYPWERDGAVTAPCDFGFPSLQFLTLPGGRAFLNLVERALDDFEKVALP